LSKGVISYAYPQQFPKDSPRCAQAAARAAETAGTSGSGVGDAAGGLRAAAEIEAIAFDGGERACASLEECLQFAGAV
jgi:hypothetical protein